MLKIDYAPDTHQITISFAGKAGWQGEDCSTVDQQVYQCLPGCSERGTYDLETGTCICDRHWTGPDCSQGIYRFFCAPLEIHLIPKFSFRLEDSLDKETWAEFLRLKNGFARFRKTELKDLRHKYSIFHLIHLSKSTFFFGIHLSLFFVLLNLVAVSTYCGSTFLHFKWNDFGSANLNEFFTWPHIGFPF